MTEKKVSRIEVSVQDASGTDLESLTRRMTVADKISQYIGRIVVIEGTFPIPTPNGQVAYAPAKGKLVAVYVDGFDLVEGDDPEPTTYLFANVRSVCPLTELALPKGGAGKVLA